ncbi:MAG: DegV family protein [Anaerolineales bacterium]|nr:DegV family protein [Anaerolineales bacterium]
MLKIVTDSTADMPDSWAEEYEIDIVPVNIHIGEQTYLQNIDLGIEDFYRIVDETGKIPQTSQPTPHQFREVYERIANIGDTILSMHITSKLSGTFDSAVAAARELAGNINVIPFDSASGSAALGMMCREARLLDRAGAGLEKVLERMDTIRKSVNIVLTLDTLEYAHMSGRVRALQAALASLLNVKPIAILHDGALQVVGKVRTRKASLERVMEMVMERFGDKQVNIAVVHARDPEAGLSMTERVRQIFNVKELITLDLSTSIAANLGPGTIGIVAYQAEG